MSNESPLPCLERAAATGTVARPPCVLFLHGLGCGKRSFVEAFANPDFYGGWHLLAPDFPGHGDCRDRPPEQARLETMAETLAVFLAAQNPPRAHPDNLHIIGHSMGSAVGLLAIHRFGLNPGSFINLEGNLTSHDCGLLSRRAAQTSAGVFTGEKFAKLRSRAAQSAEPGLREFAACLGDCNPRAFHIAARSLVAWSDSGRLLDFFCQNVANPVYLYGQRSAQAQTLALVRERRVKTHRLSGCGHFAFTDKPPYFHHLCARLIAASTR